VGTAAAAEDLARGTVSNWISIAALGGGLVCQFLENRWAGVAGALAGCVAGFLVFLIFNQLGGMGGGDVKLMAGFGALLGVSRLLTAAFWTALVGGVIAGVVVVVAVLRKADRTRPESIPYAPAIAIGVWLALIRPV
jgi:prepilin peptidase CpaA